MGAFRGYIVDRLFQSAADVAASPLHSSATKAGDIKSVLFAKPELRIRKTTSIITARKISAKRALTDECTIIFGSLQALHQFVFFFKNFKII